MCTNWFYIFSAYSRVYVISVINEKIYLNAENQKNIDLNLKKQYICNFKQEQKQNLWREIETLSLEKEK